MAFEISQIEKLFKESPELDIGVHQYNINVTCNGGDLVDKEKVLERYSSFDGAGLDTHLYFHLPLCDYVCHFCNYVKTKIQANSKMAELQRWSEYLINDSTASLQIAPWTSQAKIKSFYIGGGTGALLLNNRSALSGLVNHVRNHYNIRECVEWTIEGNPENFTDETLSLALDLGFNRLSVGVQSLQEEVNKFANRGHSAEEAKRAIKALLKTRKPFSVDMMFGLPYQTVETVTKDIAFLANMGVPSITIYRLRNSEREKMGLGNASVWNARLVRERLDGCAAFPQVIETYKMRDSIVDVLLSNNYFPSPCGWWNQKDTYPEGNIPRVSRDKWERYNTMLAFGPGAYGWLTGNESEFLQTHRPTKISDYMQTVSQIGPPPFSHGRLLKGQAAIGTMLAFGFKANQPISTDLYKTRFGVNLLSDEPYASVLNTLIEKGLLATEEDKRFLKPTLKGEMLHEEIMYVYFHKAIGAAAQDVLCKVASAT